MADSRVSAKAPLRILCQHDGGSCAACCGVDNFRDRSLAATDARLRRARGTGETSGLADVERDDVLFAGVKVCPFAGYVDEGRVGCLLHPTRHPEGRDLRDLGVYPKEICAGHFCAPHDWLRDVEVDLAQCAHGVLYGRTVTDAGLVKAVARLLSDALGRALTSADVAAHRERLRALWQAWLVDWPYRDVDPARFGGFTFDGDDAVTRTLPSSLAGLTVSATTTERTILDALGTRPLGADDANDALTRLRQAATAIFAET